MKVDEHFIELAKLFFGAPQRSRPLLFISFQCELHYLEGKVELVSSKFPKAISDKYHCFAKCNSSPLVLLVAPRSPFLVTIITARFLFWPKGHWGPCNEVGPESVAKCINGIWNVSILIMRTRLSSPNQFKVANIIENLIKVVNFSVYSYFMINVMQIVITFRQKFMRYDIYFIHNIPN